MALLLDKCQQRGIFRTCNMLKTINIMNGELYKRLTFDFSVDISFSGI